MGTSRAALVATFPTLTKLMRIYDSPLEQLTRLCHVLPTSPNLQTQPVVLFSCIVANLLVGYLAMNFNYILDRMCFKEVLPDDYLPEDTTPDKFMSICAALAGVQKSKSLSPQELLDICRNIVRSLHPSLNLRILCTTIIQCYKNTRPNTMDLDRDEHIIQPEIQTIMADGWDRAWETEYEERGLRNFTLYLNSLWAERKARWTPLGELTSTSFCATIVQSSCAGKSRLVHSYITRSLWANPRLGLYFIAPVLNLQEAGPHGMDGYPEGVSARLVLCLTCTRMK